MSCKLKLKNLTVAASTTGKILVNNFSLPIRERHVTAILGGSGSGKTTVCLSIMRLIPKELHIKGKILLKERKHSVDILHMDENQFHKMRGKRIAITFQEPRRYMNPIIKCGEQLMDLINCSRRIKKEKALNLLRGVRFENPKEVFNMYPFELSGGQIQKFSLALGLASTPEVLLADEPTTGLDYKEKKELEAIYLNWTKNKGVGILLVTHDIHFARRIADFAGIILGGQLLEFGSKETVLYSPLHPYSELLVSTMNIRKLTTQNNNFQSYDILPSSKGCVFVKNCKYRSQKCFTNEPTELHVEKHMVRCHLYNKL